MTAASTSPVASDSFPAAITMADLVGDLLVALAGPDGLAVGDACKRIAPAIGMGPGPDGWDHWFDLCELVDAAVTAHTALVRARREALPTAEKWQAVLLSIEEGLEMHLERLSPAEGGAA